MDEVTVIVFSKDRPFQLGEYLRTLFHYSHGECNLKVFVLAHIQKEYTTGYDKIESSFPSVTLLRETDFAQQLIDLVEGANEEGYILYGVDDALYCASIPWSAAVSALRDMPSMQCVHLRLCPGLSYCHSAGAPQVCKCIYFFERLLWNSNTLLAAPSYTKQFLGLEYNFEFLIAIGCGLLFTGRTAITNTPVW
jgi:hypothetical protein